MIHKRKKVEKHEETPAPEESDVQNPEAVNQEQVQPQAEPQPEPPPAQKRPATEPWNQTAATGANKPWLADLLHLNQFRPGFTRRWVRQDKIGMREAQGWQLAQPGDYGEKPSEENTIRRNELVLMEIPDEVAGQRRAQHAQFTDMQSKSARSQLRKEFQKISAEMGHKVRVEKEEDDDVEEE